MIFVSKRLIAAVLLAAVCAPAMAAEKTEYLKSLEKTWVNSVLVKNKLISSDDVHLFQLKHSSKEAYRAIHDFYRVYHSLRYCKGLTILRFTQPISKKIIDRLNVEFEDIITEGTIYSSSPSQEEIQSHDKTLKMPRLIFKFDKQSFGRLNQMIRNINEWVD